MTILEKLIDNKNMQYVLFLIKTNLSTQAKFFKEQKLLIDIIFMHCVEYKTVPFIFLTKFCKPSYDNPTNFLTHNFLVPTLKSEKSKYRVSIRGQLIWNNILTAAERNKKIFSKFLITIKEKFISMANEINYF